MLNKITYYWFSIFNENFRCRYRNIRSNRNQQFKLRFIVNIKFDFPPNSCVTWSFWQLFTISNSNLRARGQMIAWNEYEYCMDSSRNRMAEEINDSVKLVVKENTLKLWRLFELIASTMTIHFSTLKSVYFFASYSWLTYSNKQTRKKSFKFSLSLNSRSPCALNISEVRNTVVIKIEHISHIIIIRIIKNMKIVEEEIHLEWRRELKTLFVRDCIETAWHHIECHIFSLRHRL